MSAKVTVIEIRVPLAAPVANIEQPVAILNPVTAAFQQNAFQSNAFQMIPVAPAMTAAAFPASVTIIGVLA